MFLAGFCLIILQFFMIREISAMLMGTELVILLVTVAYFAGYSIGYGAAGFFTERMIKAAAVVTWLLHITLPFSLRYIGGALVENRGYGAAFFFILFFTAFALSSFFSLLLPRFIDTHNGEKSLARLYGAELAGAVAGVGAIVSGGAMEQWALPLVYQTALALIVGLMLKRVAAWPALLMGVAAYGAVFDDIQRQSISYYYHSAGILEDAETIQSVNSPYQKVDFLRTGHTNRHIFLNGRHNYGSSKLSLFNTFLTRVPIILTHPKETLIIGSGSMESVRYASKHSDFVTTVEIDESVINGSRKFLWDINRLDQVNNWTLVIEDAKRFLGSGSKKYDVIIVDVPVPLTIQVGLLHSVDFYRMARERLTENGVISVALGGTFRRDNPTPQTVASAVAEAFEDFVVYTPDKAGRSFAIGGRRLTFNSNDLVEASQSLGAEEVDVYLKPVAVNIIDGQPPIRMTSVGYPVKRSLNNIYYKVHGKDLDSLFGMDF